MAAIGNALGRRHAARRLRDEGRPDALQPLIGHGDVQRRPARRGHASLTPRDGDSRPSTGDAPPGSPGSRRSAPRRSAIGRHPPSRCRRPTTSGDVAAAARSRSTGHRSMARPATSSTARPSADGPFDAIDHGGRRRAGRAARPPYARHDGTRPRRRPGTRSRASRPIEAPVGALSPAGRRGARSEAGATRRRSGRRRARVTAGSNGRGARSSARSISRCCSGAPAPAGTTSATSCAEAFRIVRDELGVRMRPGPRHPPRLARGLPRARRAARSTTSTRVDDALDRLLDDRAAARSSSSRSCRATSPRTRTRPSSTTRDHLAAARPWSAGRTSSRDLVAPPRRPLRPRRGPHAGRSRSGTSRTCASSGPATESDYLALYDATARAVKAVDPAFRVGGPATAAVGWVDDLLEHCRARRRPARLPLDAHLRHAAARPAPDRCPLRASRPAAAGWTEWGVSPTHGAPLNDSVLGARRSSRAGCARQRAGSMRSSYWVASDHFVELGEARALFHGGFGLLTIGNLRKPRFWALAMLERARRRRAAGSRSTGDGAGSLVEAWATRDPRRPRSRSPSGTARSTRRSRMAPASWDAT